MKEAHPQRKFQPIALPSWQHRISDYSSDVFVTKLSAMVPREIPILPTARKATVKPSGAEHWA